MAGKLETLYKVLRLSHYRRLFAHLREKAGSLSATEAFTAEIVYLLDEPTLCELADFLSVSQPNATYKVNSLVTKGYIQKSQNDSDKRTLKLQVTEKFLNYYGGYLPDIERAFKSSVGEFSDAERAVINRFLDEFVKKAKSI